VGALASGALAFGVRRAHRSLPEQAGVLAFVGALLGWMAVAIVTVNWGIDDWRAAQLGWGWVAGSVASALGVGFAAARSSQVLRAGMPASPAAVPGAPLPLGADERVAWFGHARGAGLAILATALVALGTVVVLATGAAAVGLTFLAVGAVVAAFTTVHVAITDDGVRVHGALPWPRLHLPLGEIDAARAVDWRPMSSGTVSGWGYRGSLHLFGRAGWVLRAGPALDLDVVGGKRFAVTVDGADEAAAVVNGLVARARQRAG
jgi:hypothetical protein